MRAQEIVALFALVLIIVVFPIGVVAYRRGYLQGSVPENVRVIELAARAPEAGGWDPETITVNKGDIVRLRISGMDVVHGFAIGRMGVESGPIYPGKVRELEFTADRVGRFTYYCNVWCSHNHYRMRGTLEVLDPDNPEFVLITEADASRGTVDEDPDIDAPHEATFFPRTRPSALRGGAIYGPNPPNPEALAGLDRTSPSDVFRAIQEGASPLMAASTGRSVAPAETWDVIAYLWSLTTTPESVAQGGALYRKNCVGCHGEKGAGDGPSAPTAQETVADFTQAETMAGGTSQIYAAKMRRGGMGTGMPYFGTIFTEEELESVVDYLWTFTFAY